MYASTRRNTAHTARATATPAQIRAARTAAENGEFPAPAVSPWWQPIPEEIAIDKAKKKVARALREARQARGLYSRQVAAETGCSERLVTQYERDGITPANKWYYPLCLYYRLDPLSFGFPRPGDKTASAPGAAHPALPRGKQP